MDIQLTVSTVKEMGEKAEAYWALFGDAPDVAVRGTFRCKDGDLVFVDNFRAILSCGYKWMDILVSTPNTERERVSVQSDGEFDILLSMHK